MLFGTKLKCEHWTHRHRDYVFGKSFCSNLSLEELSWDVCNRKLLLVVILCIFSMLCGAVCVVNRNKRLLLQFRNDDVRCASLHCSLVLAIFQFAVQSHYLPIAAYSECIHTHRHRISSSLHDAGGEREKNMITAQFYRMRICIHGVDMFEENRSKYKHGGNVHERSQWQRK